LTKSVYLFSLMPTYSVVNLGIVLENVSVDSNFSKVFATDYTKEVLDPQSELNENVLAIIGDSIGEGAMASDVSHCFMNLLSIRLGMTPNRATAKGGWCYGDVSNSSNAWMVTNYGTQKGLYSRTIANLTGNEKIVLFEAGTNDHGMSVPLGSVYTDVSGVMVPNYDVTTTLGGMNQALKNIYDTIGHVNIIVITPIHKNYYTSSVENSFDGSRKKNSCGLYLKDYVDGIKEFAKFWGLPICDMFTLGDMNPYLSDVYSKLFYEGIHPNDAGHQRYADILYRFITGNIVVPYTYSGTVMDSNSTPIQGASVNIVLGNNTNVSGISGYSTITDANGLFKIKDIISECVAKVTVSKSGYTSEIRTIPKLYTDQSTTFHLYTA